MYGADLCDVDGNVHVVCVDYLSFFIQERPLPDMQLDTVILGLKMIFSENGFPEILITDNGQSFISEDFKQFAMEWSLLIRRPHLGTQREMLMLNEQLAL